MANVESNENSIDRIRDLDPESWKQCATRQKPESSTNYKIFSKYEFRSQNFSLHWRMFEIFTDLEIRLLILSDSGSGQILLLLLKADKELSAESGRASTTQHLSQLEQHFELSAYRQSWFFGLDVRKKWGKSRSIFCNIIRYLKTIFRLQVIFQH